MLAIDWLAGVEVKVAELIPDQHECMTHKNSKNVVKTLILMVLFLYALLPSESNPVTLSLWVRLVAVFLVGVFFARYARVNRINELVVIVTLLAFLTATALLSFSLRYIIACAGLVVGYLFYSAVANNTVMNSVAANTLSLLIYISGLSLLIQAGLYHIGFQVDIHGVLFPWSSGRVQQIGELYRLGGLYIEPGTLANWVYATTILHAFVIRRIEMRLVLVASVIMCMSLSAWGVLVGAWVLLVVFFTANPDRSGSGHKPVRYIAGKVMVGLLGGVLVVGLLSSEDLMSFMQVKMSFETGSGYVRTDALDAISASWESLLFTGQGFNPSICSECKSFQDAGLVLSLLVIYGAAFSLFLVGVVLYAAIRVGGTAMFLVTLPLFTSKLFYWDFIFTFVFVLSVGYLLKGNKEWLQPQTGTGVQTG